MTMTTIGKKFSLFPIEGELAKMSYKYYLQQQEQLWVSHEIDLSSDREEYHNMPQRYQELYAQLLGFFSCGDGLICNNILRFAKECDTFGESAFYSSQIYIETVHAEAYGLAITSVIKDPKKVQAVVEEVDNNPASRAKADFIQKYIDGDMSKIHRLMAAACSEGIFFVTLFAIIFYFKSKNVMTGFVTLNEQVAKDETLHRNFYCDMVKYELDMLDLSNASDKQQIRDELYQIVQEALEIELNHLKYILATPVDSQQTDTIAGLTIDNLSDYAKTLGDEIIRLTSLGQPLYPDVKAHVPWLKGIGMDSKANFYERLVVNYRNTPKEDTEIDLDNLEDEDF